jgi:hypothetical protein
MARGVRYIFPNPKPMISSLASTLRRAAVLGSLCFLTASLFAQTDPNAGDNGNRRQRRNQAQDQNAGDNANGNNRGGRGNFSPEEMQQRIMTAMREQLGVTDDAEWKVISERVAAVTELRRSTGGGLGGGGFGGFRGGQNGQGGQGGQNRGFRGASPEQDALRQAVTDNLPDAEIKSRLERLRETRKANEEKLAKAQEDLRAVLNVRQEAVAVMFGLLP